MTDLNIEHEIVIDAPVDVVWRTITEPDQIARWFANRVELDARPGGRGVLVFENENSDPQRYELFVETVDAPRRFAFRWCQPVGEPAVAGNSLLVEFTLTAENDERTRLRVVETGLDVIDWSDDDKAKHAGSHRDGWRGCGDRLSALLGAGTG